MLVCGASDFAVDIRRASGATLRARARRSEQVTGRCAERQNCRIRSRCEGLEEGVSKLTQHTLDERCSLIRAGTSHINNYAHTRNLTHSDLLLIRSPRLLKRYPQAQRQEVDPGSKCNENEATFVKDWVGKLVS